MTNQFEESLNQRIINFNSKRPNDASIDIDKKLLLIKIEILSGEIPIIIKNKLKKDVYDELALCIYIECKLKSYSPEDAYQETIKQIELKKK